LAISSCKKKGTPATSVEIAANTSELRKRVKKKIKNKTRRDKVFLLVDDAHRIRGRLTLAFLEMQNRLQNNPAVSQQDIEAEFADFAEARVYALREMARMRLEMRKHITEKEWKDLFPEKKKKEDADKTAEATVDKAPESEDAKTEPEGADEASEQPGGDAAETKASNSIPEKPESGKTP
jgi:hypothetical protein